jgi:hypothetical protein
MGEGVARGERRGEERGTDLPKVFLLLCFPGRELPLIAPFLFQQRLQNSLSVVKHSTGGTNRILSDQKSIFVFIYANLSKVISSKLKFSFMLCFENLSLSFALKNTSLIWKAKLCFQKIAFF